MKYEEAFFMAIRLRSIRTWLVYFSGGLAVSPQPLCPVRPRRPIYQVLYRSLWSLLYHAPIGPVYVFHLVGDTITVCLYVSALSLRVAHRARGATERIGDIIAEKGYPIAGTHSLFFLRMHDATLTLH